MKNLAQQIKDCFDRGGKLIWLGNGGSMAESSHASAEFTGLGLPSIVLSDSATLSALANDFGYEKAFYLWVKSLYNHGEDLVISLSSSGKSKNLIYLQKHLVNLNHVDFPRKGKTTSEVQNNQLKLIHQIYEEFKK